MFKNFIVLTSLLSITFFCNSTFFNLYQDSDRYSFSFDEFEHPFFIQSSSENTDSQLEENKNVTESTANVDSQSESNKKLETNSESFFELGESCDSDTDLFFSWENPGTIEDVYNEDGVYLFSAMTFRYS